MKLSLFLFGVNSVYQVAAWGKVGKAIEGTVSDGVGAIVDVGEDIGSGIVDFGEDVSDVVQDGWKSVQSGTMTAVSWIEETAEEGIDQLESIDWKNIFDDIGDFFNDAWDDVEDVTQEAVDACEDAANAVADVNWEAVTVIANEEMWKGVGNAIADAAVAAAEFVQDLICETPGAKTLAEIGCSTALKAAFCAALAPTPLAPYLLKSCISFPMKDKVTRAVTKAGLGNAIKCGSLNLLDLAGVDELMCDGVMQILAEELSNVVASIVLQDPLGAFTKFVCNVAVEAMCGNNPLSCSYNQLQFCRDPLSLLDNFSQMSQEETRTTLRARAHQLADVEIEKAKLRIQNKMEEAIKAEQGELEKALEGKISVPAIAPLSFPPFSFPSISIPSAEPSNKFKLFAQNEKYAYIMKKVDEATSEADKIALENLMPCYYHRTITTSCSDNNPDFFKTITSGMNGQSAFTE